MEESERSLTQIFDQANDRREKLDNLDPRSEEFKQNLTDAIKGFEESRKLVKSLALFSPNESVDEVSTHNLQFLSVNYHLAELLLRSYDSDRRATLQKVLDLFDEYLTTLDQYEHLSTEDQKLYERFQETPRSFSLISTTNFEERRKIKIARFQEEKALKEKLRYLRTHVNHGNDDDEVIRNLRLAETSFYVNQTFHSLDMITQELSILSQAQAESVPVQNDVNGTDVRAPTRSNQYSERLDGPLTLGGLGRNGGPLLSTSGKPLQPFTLLDKRTQLRQGVFRPGHNLPTMSIDEYLEEERKRGGIVDGGGNANDVQPEPDEDNIELVDAATVKAREWDEFVEANPKGAGNTLNRG